MTSALISIFYFFGTPALAVLPASQFGYLNVGMALPVIFGSILTAPFGVRVAHRVSPRTQQLVFASIVGLILVKTLFFS